LGKALRNTLLRILVVVLALTAVISVISLRMQHNDLKEKAKELEDQVELLQDEVDREKAELEHPFDEEYVAKIAKEKLGLRYPQEIVIYGNSGN
jgi:cell division protein FtsL